MKKNLLNLMTNFYYDLGGWSTEDDSSSNPHNYSNRRSVKAIDKILELRESH